MSACARAGLYLRGGGGGGEGGSINFFPFPLKSKTDRNPNRYDF